MATVRDLIQLTGVLLWKEALGVSLPESVNRLLVLDSLQSARSTY